jgi:hypothetical protein
MKERLTMLDSQLHIAIMATEGTMGTEDRIRTLRGQNGLATRGIKRIFRLPGDRLSQRQSGRR